MTAALLTLICLALAIVRAENERPGVLKSIFHA